MADKDKDEELLKEIKEALKPDPPALKRIKESGKAAGAKLPRSKKS